jgi:hypothetical protein
VWWVCHIYLKKHSDIVPAALTEEEWGSVLKLANMWGFSEIRERAIQEMSKTRKQPADGILLGKEYRVVQWLLNGVAELVIRDVMISEEEAEKLGLKMVLKLCGVRETYRAKPRNHYDDKLEIGPQGVKLGHGITGKLEPFIYKLYGVFEDEIREADPEIQDSDMMARKWMGRSDS